MRTPPTKEIKEEVARLYAEGRSAREVARALQDVGVAMSHQTVLNFCREAGVIIRPPHTNNTTS